ncbi:PH domain-containing protein [Roseimicrobium sp. ORNL1]|uniref:PH domain-containing protein n=1 Tax=Roseimicrobium sp. ORNL1 TaxID=2711231 RepID=UPI0013E1C4B5|nr:PH domain-containing protein [Roseimicrobium sp. ORNL1]QIF03728.1 PH domain-containing protein [Roseimicrobium sp. ORNL1]
MASANARYFLPDHPTLKDVYSKNDLRAMLVAGTLSRSDMVLDDETGHGHLLGDLLAMPYPDVTIMPSRSTGSSSASGTNSGSGSAGSGCGNMAPRPQLPPNHEFRADTPLPRPETDFRPPSQRRTTSREERAYQQQRDDAGDDDEEEEQDDDATFEDEDDLDDALLDERAEDYHHEDEDEDAEEEGHPDAPAQHLRPPTPAPASTTPVQEWRPGHPYGGMMRAQLGPVETFYPEERGPEETLYQGHPSWLAYPKSLLALLLLIISAVVSHRMQFGLEWVLLFGSVAGLILLFVGLDRFTCAYIVTTRRVEMEYGVLGRNTREVRIRDIRSIDVQQGGWRALLGMGNVRFDSSVSSGPEVYFRDVHRPHAIKELVREMQK